MIRPASVADLWDLRRKPRRRIFFYNDALLASSYHPHLLALKSLPDSIASRSDQITLVLRDKGLCGYIQARRRPNRPEIDLQFITVYGRRNQPPVSDGDVFFQLLEEMLRRAGDRQTQRIFAAVSTRATDLIEVLRQLGFQPYAQQSIWMLADPAVEAGSSMVALRRQGRRDPWAINQLYTSVTPRHVQQAELRESPSWQMPRANPWIRDRERGWVLGNDQSLTVHVQVRSGARGHVMRVMLAPHHLAETAAMLRYVLSQLHDERPIFAILRTYQTELRSALEELNFVERGEQTLFVKHLALRQYQPSFLPTLLRPEPGEGALSISTLAVPQRDAEIL